MSTSATGTDVALSKPRLRGRIHQGAFWASLPLGALVVVRARDADARLCAVVYAVAIAAMLGVSALYHRGVWSAQAARRLRRIDHSTILLAIAGTYTPIVALGVGGRTAVWLLWTAWVGAALGVILRMRWMDAPSAVVAAVYVVVGWSSTLAFPELLRHLGVVNFALVLSGGLLYSAGAVVYALHRPDPRPAVFGYHEVFHTFVVAAALAHYVVVFRVIDR